MKGKGISYQSVFQFFKIDYDTTTEGKGNTTRFLNPLYRKIIKMKLWHLVLRILWNPTVVLFSPKKASMPTLFSQNTTFKKLWSKLISSPQGTSQTQHQCPFKPIIHWIWLQENLNSSKDRYRLDQRNIILIKDYETCTPKRLFKHILVSDWTCDKKISFTYGFLTSLSDSS